MDISVQTRSLNTWFQSSGNRDTHATYCVEIAANLSLSGGETGTVILEQADDSSGTNPQEVARAVNGNTGTLTIGLNITQTVTALVSGMILAAKYARIRTVNTAGTPTMTFRSSQEALL